MKFAARKFGPEVDHAWGDFHLGEVSGPFEADSEETPIFMPYFLFLWDPDPPRRRSKIAEPGGIVARWFRLEKAAHLSELELQILDQAMSQPLSFYEVASTEPGERMELVDVLMGGRAEVLERSASGMVRPGDIIFAQVWSLPVISMFGCIAPVCIPPVRKSEIIELRAELRKRVAKQNRPLSAKDLARYSDEIRATYLDICDEMNTLPRLQNTDGDPLVFHTLTFQIESAEAAFEALAHLAVGRSKEDLLSNAELNEDGMLRSVEFDWLKLGNSKHPTWDNTILGNIRISQDSLVAEVNSEGRATRLRNEIEKRLGPSATHLRTVARRPDELLRHSRRGAASRADTLEDESERILRDPEVRRQMQETIQKEAEAWVYQKLPVLGGRTPLQAVRDPDGLEIVQSLLVQFERDAKGGAFPKGVQPDIKAVRRLLNLNSPP